MSQENVEIVLWAYGEFRASGELVAEIATPDFVWDMSHFSGWLDGPLYEGVEGARRFLEEWTTAWDDWELEIEAVHDAGEKVVAIARQRGRSKVTGVAVEMLLAQVWTMRDGKQARMEMYSDPAEALKAVGLAD
jgi:ketosteroid isomerase-like protein